MLKRLALGWAPWRTHPRAGTVSLTLKRGSARKARTSEADSLAYLAELLFQLGDLFGQGDSFSTIRRKFRYFSISISRRTRSLSLHTAFFHRVLS